jgi:hypothetical protein
MKIVYSAPAAETIVLTMEQTVCQVSGGKFTLHEGSGTTFDDDSD